MMPSSRVGHQVSPEKKHVPSRSMHVKITTITLPPNVPSDVKGEVVVGVETLTWECRGAPDNLQLRIKWWGNESEETLVPFHPSRGAGATFPVVTGPKQLVRYLRDMATLVLSLEECPSGKPIGTITIPVHKLDVTKPISSHYPLLGLKDQVLARAAVSARIIYTGLMSSFEMNEHLASTDKGLPLYPRSAPRPPGVSGQPRAVGKENSTAGRKQQVPKTLLERPSAATST
jgi:hypothetical protein